MVYTWTEPLWRQKNEWFLIPSNMNGFHYHTNQIMNCLHFLVSIWIHCLFAFKLNYYATIRWEMYMAWLTCYLWCTVLSQKNTFTTQSSCIYLNMFVCCLIKAGHHRQSANFILQSLRIFPSRYNAASGYLQIVLQILNSVSIDPNFQCTKYSNWEKLLNLLLQTTPAYNKLKVASIWISNLSIFSIPDELQFRNVPRALY